jgi:hypothetical protein
MQYVNDDMDELFKRAAEDYPLHTNSADWNKVLAALQSQDEKGNKTVSEKKTNKNGRFLWLLLLLPLGFICNRLYSPADLGDNASETGVKTNTGSSNKVKEVGDDSSDSKIQNITGADNSISNHTDVNLIDRKGIKPVSAKGTTNSLNLSVALQKKSNKFKSSRTNTNSQGTGYYDGVFSGQQRNSSVADENLKNHEVFSSRYVYEIPFYKKSLDGVTTAVKKDMNPLFESPKSKENIRVAKRKKFYAGLMGGMDVTTIKLQKIEDAGYGYGMLIGYQFNKKWSVETGAFLEKKYYYSDGKYLNTSKIYLPPNSRIEDATGNCKMVEMPLAVKYNFSIRKESTWFATLGISSYFMKEENYTYNYYYGTSGPVPHQKEYKNSSTDLFSAMSISGGYIHRLGNFADVRIEPYLKLPMYGMGIGELPFLSTGLQVGITKKF